MMNTALNPDTEKDAIVIFRLGSLGDTIVALPCFHAILRHFPNARRVVLTNMPVSSKAAPLLGVLGTEGQFIDEAIEYPVGLRSISGLLALRRRLRAVGARKLIYLMPERSGISAWRDWLYFRFCGFSEIVAFPTHAGMRQSRVGPDGEVEPEANRLVRCCAMAFGPIDLAAAENWDLKLTQEEVARGLVSVSPIGLVPRIAINMGGKAAEKDWSVANWRKLAARLGERWPDLGLMTVGANDDRSQAEDLLKVWKGPKINLCGELTPRETAAALIGCVGFIGHDSGPLHVAAALGVPVLGLFGNFNRPIKWHPIGPMVSIIHQMKGMQAISVDEVERAAVALIRNGLGQGGLIRR